jgi:uncharacterized protein (TIGR03067 family)
LQVVNGKPAAEFWNEVDRIAETTAKAIRDLQGVWQCVAGEELGKLLDEGEIQRQNRRLTFKGDSMVMERTIAGKLGRYTGTFAIDVLNSQFDWSGTFPDGGAITFVGIHELNDDTLKLCFRYQQTGSARRPITFKSDAEQPNFSVCFTFQRGK